MRVALTGTPGTGKTTVSEIVQTDLRVVHLNEVIPDAELTQGYDVERNSWIADIDHITEYFSECSDVLFESHIAHYLPVEKVIVLRCHPDELRTRLEERGESDAKIDENVLSEAHDVILTKAVENQGVESVYEIDTSGHAPRDIARMVEDVIQGKSDPHVGIVSFLDEL